MNSMKKSLVALCGVFACVGVVDAQADMFSDVSAAFSAEVTTTSSQYAAVATDFGIAMANNDEVSVLNVAVVSSFTNAVDTILAMTDTTGDAHIDSLVSDYKLAVIDFEKVVNSTANFIGGGVQFASASAGQDMTNASVVLDDAFETIIAARDNVKFLTQYDVTGVSQERIDAAQDLFIFGEFDDDAYGLAKTAAVETVETGGGEFVPVTADVVAILATEDTQTVTFLENELYPGSPSDLELVSSDIIAIRDAYEAKTKVAFYEANGSQEITAAHITAAETLIAGGVIRDVTQTDIDTAVELVLFGSISSTEIAKAVITAARTEVLQTEIVVAMTMNESLVTATNNRITVNLGEQIVVLANTVDLSGGLVLNEDVVAAAQVLLDSGEATGSILTEMSSAAEAQEIIDIWNRGVLIAAGAISQDEIDKAKITAAMTPVDAQDLFDARALIKAGTKEVLTQAEFDAAQILVADMGVVQEVLDAAVEAQNAVLEAIKNSDDKALKSALKALESTVVSMENVIVANTRVADAIAAVNAGTMSIGAFNEKIKPDVGVAMSGAMSGVTVANNTISNHQNAMVASSGKYGFSQHSGVNSGTAHLDMGVWLKAFGSEAEMDMRDSVAGYDVNTRGIVLGIDQRISSDLLVGVALSFADVDVEGKSIARSITDTEQVQGTLYGTLFMGDFYINGSMAYAHSASDTERTGFGGAVTAEYDTSVYSASIGAGMPIDMESYAITPQVTLAYSYVDPDSYTERGFGALNVEPESMDLFGVKVGVTLNKKLNFEGGTLSPKLRLIADWDVLQEKARVNSSWASTGTTITPTLGAEPAALGGIIGAGLDYTTDDGIYVLSLDYDLSTRSDFVSHAASAQFRLNF